MAKILGVSCSLRNARFGSGSDSLIDEIKALDDQDALQAYLENQTRIRAADFIEAGREEGLPFDKIYRNLKKAKGDQGLSNSEAALVASLWGAHREDCEIAHVGLSPFFPMNKASWNSCAMIQNAPNMCAVRFTAVLQLVRSVTAVKKPR